MEDFRAGRTNKLLLANRAISRFEKVELIDDGSNVSCQKQATKMGTPFKPLKLIRRAIKEKCEAAERAAAGR